MKRHHIAFLGYPHSPCVHPTLSLVETLRRRGHRVTYVTSKRFAPRVAATGAEIVLSPELVNRFLPLSPKAYDHQVPSFGEDFIDLAVGTLPKATAFYEKNRPDCIVYDFLSLAGRVLVKTMDIPAIQTSPAFLFDRATLDHETMTSEFRRAVLDTSNVCETFLAQYNIKGDICFHRERLNIFFYTRECQLPMTASDDSCFYAARCAGEQPYERTWSAPPSCRPLVLVSTSTYYVQGPEYFRMCIDALADLPWHVVLSIGSNNDPSTFAGLPANVEILQNVPQIQVLPYSDLFVCLGGMTSAIEAMYHGVPMLFVTHGFAEPELYADTMVRVGVGRHLKKENTTAENIRKLAIEMSADQALNSRVRQVQRSVQQAPGAEETANLIIDYIERS